LVVWVCVGVLVLVRARPLSSVINRRLPTLEGSHYYLLDTLQVPLIAAVMMVMVHSSIFRCRCTTHVPRCVMKWLLNKSSDSSVTARTEWARFITIAFWQRDSRSGAACLENGSSEKAPAPQHEAVLTVYVLYRIHFLLISLLSGTYSTRATNVH
jgi:hypothetical protein